MELPRFEAGMDKAIRDFRDGTMSRLITFVESRAKEVEHIDPKLFALLEELAEQTKLKQEKRVQLSEFPNTAEDIIGNEQKRIIEISKQLETEYPEELYNIEQQNVLLQQIN